MKNRYYRGFPYSVSASYSYFPFIFSLDSSCNSKQNFCLLPTEHLHFSERLKHI
nr:MAG TPA: hypothetical protein [Caudoviricetes sp.]